MDPHDKTDMKRLMGAVDGAWRGLEKPREICLSAIREYVGYHYTDNGSEDKRPMNMIELAATVYCQKLVGTAPQALITTPHKSLKAECKDYQTALNYLANQIGLEDTLRESVLWAVFGMGVVKVGLADEGIETLMDYTFEKSQPYADVVMFEDFVFDLKARSPRNWQFAGHKYRIPLEDAKSNRLFKESARKKLVATSKQDNAVRDEESVTDITDGETPGDADEIEPFVELWELWLPFEGLIVTVAVDGDHNEPLRVEEWKGPAHGPYHILGFNDVPGNVLPLAPAAIWTDLNTIINDLYNKLTRQATNAKTVFLYSGGDETTASNAMKAGDGAFIRTDSPQSVVPTQIGYIDNNALAFQMNAKDAFDFQAGNLSSMAGLGAQTSTVGQEKLLSSGANDRMNKYQRTVERFTQRIMHDLAYWLWNEPTIMPPMTRPLKAGSEYEVPVSFDKDTRQGKFLDYNIQIEPYSLQTHSPSEKYQFVMQFLQQFVFPIMPQLEAQGITVNYEAAVEMASCFNNIPELLDILVFSGTPSTGGYASQGPVEGPSPSVTTRQNVRVQAPGRTQKGQSQIMQQALVGGRPQQSEMASLGR